MFKKFKYTFAPSAIVMYSIFSVLGLFCLGLAIKLFTWPVSLILSIVGIAFLSIVALRFYTFYKNEADTFISGKALFKLLGNTKELVTPEKQKIIDNAIDQCSIFIQNNKILQEKYGKFKPNGSFMRGAVLIFSPDPIRSAGLSGLNHGVTNGNVSAVHYDNSHNDIYLDSIVQHEYCHICFFSLDIPGELHHELMKEIGFEH